MTPWRVTIHCSATPNGKPVSVDEIRRWHTAPPPVGRGWREIGYHVVIDVDGTVGLGRSLTEPGAHVGDLKGDLWDCEGHKDNDGNIGICLIGETRFSRAQFDSLRNQLDGLITVYGIKHWEIRAHNQFASAQKQGKTCPNMEINRLLAWYWLQDLDAIKPYLR